MEIFKHFLFAIITLFLLSLLWVYNQISGESFTDWFFPLLGPKGKEVISNLVFIVGFSLASFKFGKDWRDFFNPITKFKIFLRKKIKQGEKLNRSTLSDEPKRVYLEENKIEKRRLEMPDGSIREVVLDSYMDNMTEFRKFYSKWRGQVFCGVEFSLGSLTAKKLLENDQIPPGYNQYGHYREALVKDLVTLKLLNPYSTALEEKFKKEPFILEEFENFKCP